MQTHTGVWFQEVTGPEQTILVYVCSLANDFIVVIRTDQLGPWLPPRVTRDQVLDLSEPQTLKNRHINHTRRGGVMRSHEVQVERVFSAQICKETLGLSGVLKFHEKR